MYYSTIYVKPPLILECPEAFTFVQGYANGLDSMIMMVKHANTKAECGKFCELISTHCHSILWNEGQQSCILDKARENDVNNFGAGWNGWVTCVKGTPG